MKTTLLAVNGTLMRGLALNANMLAAGARFVRDDETDACYRVWSIDDRHPAMLRTPGEGTRVAVELWEVPVEGLATILLAEPPGLAIGKVVLRDGSVVLGVLGEPFLCRGQLEITEFGGWRAYMASKR
ncbi:MAG: glutamyl-tRNA amidotransferase [Betaproteobacteria bacterium]|nr:MAG: glutamyl-tRNA amidotransferase [Betaproteobacteria bacterium]